MVNHLNRKKILFTLQDIRNARPCADGWTKLLKALPANAPLTTRLSLGDVAQANNAADALWCVRVLDWSDITVRRRVISTAVLPAVLRASKNTQDAKVHERIKAIGAWCEGNNFINLEEATWWKSAWAESAGSAAWAAKSAACAAKSAACAAKSAAWAAWAAKSAALAAWSAALAAESAESARSARSAELDNQQKDIITAFTPVILIPH